MPTATWLHSVGTTLRSGARPPCPIVVQALEYLQYPYCHVVVQSLRVPAVCDAIVAACSALIAAGADIDFEMPTAGTGAWGRCVRVRTSVCVRVCMCMCMCVCACFCVCRQGAHGLRRRSGGCGAVRHFRSQHPRGASRPPHSRGNTRGIATRNARPQPCKRERAPHASRRGACRSATAQRRCTPPSRMGARVWSVSCWR